MNHRTDGVGGMMNCIKTKSEYSRTRFMTKKLDVSQIDETKNRLQANVPELKKRFFFLRLSL